MPGDRADLPRGKGDALQAQVGRVPRRGLVERRGRCEIGWTSASRQHMQVSLGVPMEYQHPPVDAIVCTLAEARRYPRGSIERIRRLERVVSSCPFFVPALVGLATEIQLLDGVPNEDWPTLETAGAYLETAVEVSERAVEPLVEWAYFVDIVQDRALKAEPLFEEAAARALKDLEGAWIGLAKIYIELEKVSEAGELLDRARTLFPKSVTIQDLSLRVRPTSGGSSP